MLVAFLLLVAAQAQYRRKDMCPSVVCSTFLEASTCGQLDYTDYSFLVRPCGLGLSCQPAATASEQDTLQCVARQDTYGFQYQSLMELYLSYHNPALLLTARSEDGVAPRTLGDICNSGDSWCARDQGFACHCQGECRCVLAGQENDRCSEALNGKFPACAWGLGCHQGYCVPWFSVTRGLPVGEPWLCASMATYDDGSCIPAESSTWNITVPCTSSSDCTGSSGSPALCTCGLLGRAYCPPFALDPPYQQLQAAIIAGDLQVHAKWRAVIDNWAQLQRGDGRTGWTDHPACVGDVWPEFAPYLRTLTYHSDLQLSAGVLLTALTLPLLLSS